MIVIRTLKGDKDTLEGVEAETPAGEMSLALGVKGKIERESDFDPEKDQVILYRVERMHQE